MACDGDDVIGFIALRDGTHVFHLFVEPAYQGRRIASALWARVHDGSSAAFTVNASLNAVPVYEAFGFVPAGEVTEAHGVRFLPMRRVRVG